MNTPLPGPTGTEPVGPVDTADPDLAEQALPGHGIPSQDPNNAAQEGLTPDEAEREAKSAYVGGGAMAGLATGAAVGAVVGGPIGVLIGGTVGTIAGALGGEAAGTLHEPEAPSANAVRPPSGVEGPERELPP